MLQVCEEIARQEANIADVKKTMYHHENTLKVAQTRLHVRENRPNVECCRDPAQYKYETDMSNIADRFNHVYRISFDVELAVWWAK